MPKSLRSMNEFHMNIRAMSKMLRVLAISLLFNISVYCQDANSIYSECGVIFPASYNLSIEISGLVKRFTPTIEGVKAAEQIFITQFKDLDHSKSNFPKAFQITNTKDYFRRFIRQYIGYEDVRGNRNILIDLIDNSRP